MDSEPKDLSCSESAALDFSMLFRHAPAAMAILTPAGRVIEANAALERLLGGHASLVVNELPVPTDGSQPVVTEQQFPRGDGTPGWARISLCPAPAGSGPENSLIAFFEDITAAKAVHEQLRQLSLAVEQSPATVMVTDAAGNIEYLNPKFSEVTGYSRAEVIGTNPRVLKSGRMKPAEYQRLWSTISSGKTWRGEFLNKRKDGSFYWESASISPVLGDDGAIAHFVAVKEDITARKNLESQIQQAQRMEAIGQLAGGVAHQFNNLLTIITGFGQLIMGRMEPQEPAHEEMLEILKAAARASKLTEQLLTFGQRKLTAPLTLQPSELLTELVAPLRRIVGETVEVATDLQANACVRVDPAEFEQVILNLAANARDAMPAGGALTISTHDEILDGAAAAPIGLEAGPHVVIIVRDTGRGIPAEDLPRIFDPVFTPTQELGGSGLGLATACGIVQQNGGVMTVESEPGNGSAFRILLPACEAAREAPITPAKPASESLGTETVLLVDDEGGVRNMVKRILERHGYHVLEAADGATAMQLVAGSQEPIQLLLTDIVMPRMSGPKLAEAVTALRTGIKTVFMSGYTDDDKVRQAVAGAEIAFLHKPFTQAELLAKVREALDPAPRLVLVADDEPGVRMTIRHMLESSGYSVLEAADGKQAIAILAREPVDLLLTDLVMPEKEGLEVIRTVRSTRPGVKVIAISGAFGGEFLRAAELLGAHASLRKPVTLEVLRKTVAGLFEAGPRA